jgi:hypothetical protein
MYYVLTKENNTASVTQFDNLSQAFKFYLEDPSKREVVKLINPKIIEG